MAKKRKSKRFSRTYKETARVPQSGTDQATKTLRDFKLQSPTRNKSVQSLFKTMDQVEDNRTRQIHYPRTIFGRPAKVKKNIIRPHSTLPFRFSDVRTTIECARRRIRRRVIFSIPGIRKKGSGAKQRKAPRYKGISCR